MNVPQSIKISHFYFNNKSTGLFLNFGFRALDSLFLQTQVSRMLRLSESDERVSSEFLKVYDPTVSSSSFVCGKVFRSPSLFEDMVKCILLCNCQYDSLLPTICLTKCRIQYRSDRTLF